MALFVPACRKTIPTMSIIISKKGKDAQRIEASTFDKENYLQQYIYDNPNSIPLYDIKEDIRLLILAREFSTNSGPIDAIGVDRDGEIYLVETKLYKNPDKRTVVAQVLDYGASLWRWSRDFNEFLSVLSQATEKQFGQTVQEKLKNFFGITDEDMVVLLDAVARNLDNGSFKFVVLMDKLESRLKDLIVYVNQNSKFDLYAVELEYYRHQEYEILIPKIYGAEVKKDIKVSSGTSGIRRKWDEPGFLETLSQQSEPETVEAVKTLYQFSKGQANEIKFGTGSTRGSFNAVFSDINPRSVYTVSTNGVLSVNFGWLNEDAKSTTFRDKLKKALEKTGFEIPENYRDHYIKYEPQDWVPKLNDFMKVIKELIE